MRAAAVDIAPFDALAPDYDASFTETLLGRLLRTAVHEEIRDVFAPGDRLLDLGCGTGEDAAWMAARGISVHGLDASPDMISRARAKAAVLPARAAASTTAQAEAVAAASSASPRGRTHTPETCFEVADLNRDPLPESAFDGAFSNFGAINCIRDRPALAERLSNVLKPGASAVFVVMGRYCPWEWAWHLARARPGTAFRRLSGSTRFRGKEIFYPTPGELSRDFAPHFRRIRTACVGLFLPPTYAGALVEEQPRLARILASAERRLRRMSAAAYLSDHYLIELQRL